jgi:hypothetical protein
MNPTYRQLSRLLVAAFLLTLASCYNVETVDGQRVYHFAGWVRALVPLAALAAVPVGWLVRRRSVWLSFVLLILAPVLLVMVAPATFVDKVVVDGQHFECRYGFWWAPSQHNVRFADLREIRLAETVSINRGGKQYHYTLHCFQKAGGEEKVPVGDLMKQALDDILSQARAAGVPLSETRAD